MKKENPNSGVPLKDWASASYSAEDGRAAKSSMMPKKSYSADGETWGVSAQLAAGEPGPGSPTWKAIDAARCQNPTPVHKRPIG